MLGFSKGSIFLFGVCLVSGHPLSRVLEVVNESGKKLVIDWVNPKTGELVTLSQPPMDPGTRVSYNSFVNHTFVIHEPVNETCTRESDGGCKVRYITISENSEQGMFSFQRGRQDSLLLHRSYKAFSQL